MPGQRAPPSVLEFWLSRQWATNATPGGLGSATTAVCIVSAVGRYEARATVDWQGFGGSVESASGMLATSTAAQVELGGPGGATNPEELFAAAHAHCFTATITSMARSRRRELAHVLTEARVPRGMRHHAGGEQPAASD